MSMLDRPGLARIKELYESRMTQDDMAEDPELKRTVLAGVDKHSSRKWKIWHTINAMAQEGIINKRETNDKAPKANESSHNDSVDSKTKSFYDKHLEEYENYIGAKIRRNAYKERSLKGRTETVVIGDPHIPDERMDLLAEIAIRHKGAACCLAGDINDFERFSRYDLRDWTAPDLRSSLARTEVVLELLSKNFSKVDILFGNHDLRLPRKVAKQSGPDYYFICQQFLMSAYETRHGCRVVQQQITKDNGRDLPGLFFYQQVGDCIIGHVEAGGAPVGKGVEIAHDFFFSRKDFLGLDPFKVVLQAHTHKQCYFRHKLTGAHLFEVGCVCDEQAYSMHQPKYGPVQQGYFHLVQYDGVTSLEESKLYSF